MKDKIESLSITEISESAFTKMERTVISDTENALASLGYNKNSIKKAIAKFLSKQKPVSSEKMVKMIIKQLYSSS